MRAECLGKFATALGAGLLAACGNAGSDLGFSPLQTGVVQVQVYLDRDGSGSPTAADTSYAGVRVQLRPPGGGRVVQTSVSAADGSADFPEAPLAVYLVTVDAASLGDSLEVGSITRFGEVRLVADALPPQVLIRLAFPEATARQIRLLPAGKRVIMRALVLSGVQSFRDTTSHVRDTSGALRLTRATVRGQGGNSPGDTVTVLGTVSTRAGQPTLDRAILSVFGFRPAPVPIQLNSATAATAQGGGLDAALVVVTGVVISESGAQGPDFRVVASDGSGALTILLDGNIPLNPAAFPVGRAMTVRGVLVPDGAGKWQLKPRDGGDVTLF